MNRISSPVPRVDAAAKAAGRASYVADLKPEGMLYAVSVRTTIARGRILSINYPDLPDGYTIVDSSDIPEGGRNTILMITDDWPVFADDEVTFLGQTIALVVGPDRTRLRAIASKVSVEYDEVTPAFSINDSLALRGGPIHGDDNVFVDYSFEKGSWEEAKEASDRVIEEEFSTGYQEHVYMEPQGCLTLLENGVLTLHASTQCPFYLKKALVNTLGLEGGKIRVVQAHTGGGFGGKEHYPDVIATAAAVATLKTKSPFQLVLDRHEDMMYTPKRHPSRIVFRTAVDSSGSILGMDIDVLLNAGAYITCSAVVLQRAIFTATGVYEIPNVRVRGRALATNTVPSDAFRGFGAPQALFAIELHMDHLAEEAGVEAVAFKKKYFLEKGSPTITGGEIRDEVLLDEMFKQVDIESEYTRKHSGLEAGRGIGVSFFNHGCAFTGSGERDAIRGKVALEKDSGDRVKVLAAGAEIGQGLFTTLRKVVAAVLDIPIDRVLYDLPDTGLVPNSGPTCASRSIMVVGYMLQEAAKELKSGWRNGEYQRVLKEYTHPPHLTWDQETLSGDAYPTYGWGVNVIEVEVDPATFEVEVVGIWTKYDIGVAIDRRIMEGQAHGGTVQGLGYAALEKLEFSDGRFEQVTMADYSIPTSLDYPRVNTDFIENPYPFGPFGAKGAGELVLDGAAPALALAVQQAVGKPVYSIPLTPESIMELIG